MDGLVHVFLGWHLNALQKLFIDSTVDLSRIENVFTQTPIIIKMYQGSKAMVYLHGIKQTEGEQLEIIIVGVVQAREK